MRPVIAIAVAALACTACSDKETPAPATEPEVQTPPQSMGAIDPGRYGFTAVGDEQQALPSAVLDVPDGFVADSSFLLRESSEGDGSPAPDSDFTAFTMWAVSGVYPDGCHDLDSPRLVPVRSAKEVLDVLHREPSLDFSAERPTSIDGHDATYVEFTSPDIDYGKCNGGSLAFFETDPGTSHVESSGILERWWVLDLAGKPVVVGTAAGPNATPDQVDAIKNIAEGTRFAEG